MNSFPDLDNATKRRILSSLEEVGRTKAVGYLPSKTIEGVLKTSVDRLARKFSRSGLSVRVFGESETCIKSGAIFVFSPSMVNDVLEAHRTDVVRMNLVLTPDQLVEKVAKCWYAEGDPMVPLIRSLYNDRIN